MPTPLPTAALVPIAVLALGLAGLTYLLLTRPKVNRPLLTNLQRGLGSDPGVAEQRLEGTSAVLRLARRLTLPARVRTLERLWSRAGRPAGWPVERLVVAKLVAPLVLGALGLLYLSAKPGGLALVVLLLLDVV